MTNYKHMRLLSIKEDNPLLDSIDQCLSTFLATEHFGANENITAQLTRFLKGIHSNDMK